MVSNGIRDNVYAPFSSLLNPESLIDRRGSAQGKGVGSTPFDIEQDFSVT